MKFSKWVIILLILSLVLNIKTGFDMAYMKKEMRSLRNNINSIDSSIGNAVSSRLYPIEQALKKEASFVNEFKYEFIEYKDKKVDFLLTVKPKVYNKGEKLFFLLKIGEKDPELIPAETTDDINYTAKVNLSVFDGADIDLVIEDGNTKKTEKLDHIYPSVEKFTVGINAEPIGGTMRYIKGDSTLVLTYDFGLFYGPIDSPSPYYKGTVALENINIDVEVNGIVIDTMPMPKDRKGRYQYYIQLKDYKIPCKANDVIAIYATAKDSNGFSYKCNLEAWTIKENGELHPAPDLFEYGKVDIY